VGDAGRRADGLDRLCIGQRLKIGVTPDLPT
jgi:hypothetical protein